MKIERLNENQIRCTLSKADLEARKLQLSELAYGSEKARALFQDMMEQADLEVGFQAENMPLMIEAIPISTDCLVLVVTKVDDPEELDTRFSRFSRKEQNEAYDEDESDDDSGYYPSDVEEDSIPADDLMGFLGRKARAAKDALLEKSSKAMEDPDILCLSFRDLDRACACASFIRPFYTGESRLYKNPSDTDYTLVLQRADSSKDLFTRAGNLASDFGEEAGGTYASLQYYDEHHRLILAENAVEVLGEF